MPTYEYACASCGNRFSMRQGFDAAPQQECPVCQAEARRVFHPVGVVFKGSGWYATDSRSSNGASSEKETVPAGDSKGDAKGDSGETKSDAKTEPVAASTSSDSGHGHSHGHSHSHGDHSH